MSEHNTFNTQTLQRWIPELSVAVMTIATVIYYSPSHALTFIVGAGVMLSLINIFGFDSRFTKNN